MKMETNELKVITVKSELTSNKCYVTSDSSLVTFLTTSFPVHFTQESSLHLNFIREKDIDYLPLFLTKSLIIL